MGRAARPRRAWGTSVLQHPPCSVLWLGWEQPQCEGSHGKQSQLGQLARFLFLPPLKYEQDPRANFVLGIFICFDHEDIQQFPSDWPQCDRTGPLPGVSLVHNLKEIFFQRDIEANHTKASWSMCSLITAKIIVLANLPFEPLCNSLKLLLFIIINYHCHFASSFRFKFHVVSFMNLWWQHIHPCGFSCCLIVTFNKRPKLPNWNIKKNKPKGEGKYIWPAVKTWNFIYSGTKSFRQAKLPKDTSELTKKTNHHPYGWRGRRLSSMTFTPGCHKGLAPM